MPRELKYAQAVLEATEQCMAADPRVYVMGLGVTDPKGTFGTTLGLESKFGPKRVLDMPTSENAMTGVAIGSALLGMRPVMTHQRADFALLAMDQLVNNASKWRFMFGGRGSVPLVVRAIVGRGWGQGPQHSQSLHATFAHFPGLKVVAPSTPHDAKGLLISAIEDDDPVVFVEHRWLHDLFGPVPEEPYRVPIGKARVARAGSDATIVASSHATVEALRAADALARRGVSVEVVDARTIKPFDADTALASAERTGRLVVVDSGWRSFGFASEVVALAAERLHGRLKSAPARVTLPDHPTPSSPALAAGYYPLPVDVANAVLRALGLPEATEEELGLTSPTPRDVPDRRFMGPF